MQNSKEKAGFKAKYWIQLIDLGLPEYLEMSEKDWETSSKYLGGDPRTNDRIQEGVQSERSRWNPRENLNSRGEIWWKQFKKKKEEEKEGSIPEQQQ